MLRRLRDHYRDAMDGHVYPWLLSWLDRSPAHPEHLMTVDVAEVRKLLARRREINRVPLGQIVWTEYGKVLNVPPAWVAEFAATGLSNTCFVDLDVYRDGLRDLHVGAPH